MCISKYSPSYNNSSICGIESSLFYWIGNRCSVNDIYVEQEFDTNFNGHMELHNLTNDEPIDISKYDFPNEMWYIIPEWEVAVKVSTFIPVILLGVIGNTLLLTIIIRNRALRTPTNLLLANMAAADLATLVLCPVMFMYNDFYQIYKLGPVGCKLEGFTEGALLITAVFNLCAVSYDRLTAIVLPLETRLTIHGAEIVMCCSWICGLLLAIPLAIYRNYKERIWRNFLEAYCSENTTVLPMYWHILIAAIVWFPLAVMVICYSAIFYKLDRYEQKVLKRENPISVSYKTKVAKTLFIVVITFVILRVPFTALIFIRNQLLKQSIMNQVDGSFQILWYTSHFLIFLNAAVNPIIYGLTNDNFRRAYNQTPLFAWFFKWRDIICSNGHRQKNQGTRILRHVQPPNLAEEQKIGAIVPVWFNGNCNNNNNHNIQRLETTSSSTTATKATITTHIKIISKTDEVDEINVTQINTSEVKNVYVDQHI